MISNRCARKSLVTNCNSIISKNYLRFLVDSNDHISFIYTVSMTKLDINHEELKKIKKKFHERLVFSRKVLLLHP